MKNGDKVEPMKLLLIGDSTVGKTCFYLRYTTGLFNSVHVTTIGVDYFPSKVDISGHCDVEIRLWDTAGQDRFRAITKNYIRGAHGILLLYDITCKKTFESVAKWISQVRDMSFSNIPIILIGNKCDLEDRREVLLDQGKELAITNNCLFTEASSKQNINVNEAITMITENAYNDYLNAREKDCCTKGKKLLKIKNKRSCC